VMRLCACHVDAWYQENRSQPDAQNMRALYIYNNTSGGIGAIMARLMEANSGMTRRQARRKVLLWLYRSFQQYFTTHESVCLSPVDDSVELTPANVFGFLKTVIERISK